MITLKANSHDNIAHIKKITPNIIYAFNFAQIRYAPANPLLIVKFYSALCSINPQKQHQTHNVLINVIIISIKK